MRDARLRYFPDRRLSQRRRDALLLAFTALESSAAWAVYHGQTLRARRLAEKTRGLIEAFGVRSVQLEKSPRPRGHRRSVA